MFWKLRILILMVLLLLISSCASIKESKTRPTFYHEGLRTSKGIERRETKGVPINPTTTFTAEDTEVIASIQLKNLSGAHTIRWDWYDPQGSLYVSSGDYPLFYSNETYFEEITVWHKLSIKNEKASDMLGKWKVIVYFDSKFIESKSFEIEAVISPNPLDKIYRTGAQGVD